MSTPLTPRRRLRLPTVEALETRIAPANVVLTPGAGPYTLEVDTTDSHLHITNGGGVEIFDQGGSVGDDLTVTGTGVDDLNILQTGGMVRFTGTLDVNIAGAIHVDGLLQAQTALSLVTSASITSSAAMSGGTVSLQSAHGIALNAAISATGSLNLNADSTNTHTGLFVTNGSASVTGGSGALTIRANTINLGSAINATAGNVTLTADVMDLTANITAGGGTVSLFTESSSHLIDLGTETAGSLSLTNAELNHVIATNLIIGDANAQLITVDAVISPASYLNLQFGQGTTFTSTGGFVADVTSASVYEHITNTQGLFTDGSGSPSLTVNAVGGYVPGNLDTFTIIASGSNPVTFQFAGKTEGATVPVGGVNKIITYNGNGGSDVVLGTPMTLTAVTNAGQLVIMDQAGGNNHLILSRSGTNYQITAVNEVFDAAGLGVGSVINGGTTVVVPASSVIGGISFFLDAGADTLTLDFSGGNVLGSGGVTFDAGNPTSGTDLLEIVGGDQGSVSYNYTGTDNGTITLGNYGLISYSFLSKIHHGGTVADYTFNLPGGATNLSLLGDDGTLGNGYSELGGSSSTFPVTDFQNPTGFVTVQRGTANDNLIVAQMPDFNAGLIIGSGASPYAAVTFSGALSLAAGKALSAFATGTISVTGGAQLALHGSGIGGLTTNTNILIDPGAGISVENGTLTLLARGTVDGNFSGISVGGSLTSTGSGNLVLTGTGGDTDSNNYGLDLHGQISATGTGSILLNGTGGSADSFNHGISALSGTISASSGIIRLTGVAGVDNGPTMSPPPAGGPPAAPTAAVGIDFGANITAPGGVDFQTDVGLTFEAGASVTSAGGTVTLEPLSAGIPIDLGTYHQDSFGVPDDAVLDAITAGHVVIGNTTAGMIVVTSDITSNNSLSLISNGTLSGTGAITLEAGKDFLVKTRQINLLGAIQVPGMTTLSAADVDVDMTVDNAANDFNTVQVLGGHTVSLADSNGFQLAAHASLILSLDSTGTISQSGAFTGGGNLLKLGAGTLQLSMANTIGNTTISNGAITFGDAGAFGSGTVTVGDANSGNNDVSLLASAAFTPGSFTNAIVVPSLVGASVATVGTTGFLSATFTNFDGPLTLNRPTILQGGNVTATFFNGAISGNVNTLTISGGHRVGFGGPTADTFAGNVQVIGSTTLQLNPGPDVIPDTSNLSLGNGSFLWLAKNANDNESINGLTGTGTVSTDPELPTRPQTLTIGTAGGSFTFDGLFKDNPAPLSLAKTGLGTATLTASQPYTGTTLILNGTLALANAGLANLLPSTPSIELRSGSTLDVSALATGGGNTFALGAAQTLLGRGTIVGNLGGSGTIAPGTPVFEGVLNITGNLQPSGQLVFKVNSPYGTAGIDYDQLAVSGSVDLSTATLRFSGGATPPPPATQFALIAHAGSSPTVAGTAPGEGATLFVGNSAFTLSYNGGDSNDVVLTTALGQISLTPTLSGGKLSVTDTVGRSSHMSVFVSLGTDLIINDALDFFSAAPAGGSLVNGNHGISIPVSKVTKGIVVDGGGGDDTLILDLSTGSNLPAGGLTFNGGTQTTPAGDQLMIMGGTQGTVTYTMTNANDGSVNMSALGKINFTGLEPIVNTGTATDVVFNLPAGPNNVTLADDGTAGNGLSRLSGSTFEQTDFSSPSHSFTINRGSATDTLTLGSSPDFTAGSAGPTFGTQAKPFGTVALNTSVTTTSPFNLAATNFTLGAGNSLSAGSGTLFLGGGTVDGTIGGGVGITKFGITDLFLNGANTYTGPTNLPSGPLDLGNALALQNSTVNIGSSFALQFLSGIGTFTIGGLAGSGDLPLTDGLNAAVLLKVGSNTSTYSGPLSGPGTLDKVGNGTLTLTGVNTHHATIVDSGILQINSDKALGTTGDALTFHGGTLHAISSLTSARPIFLESGDATFEASAGKTLTLSGVISGPGNFHIGNVGNVQVTGQANTNTGSVELVNTGSQVINGVTVTAPGNKGGIVITPGPTMNEVANIDLTAVNVPISVTVKSPKTGTVTVDKIVSNDNTAIKAVILSPRVMLGDGEDDSTPDLVINGKLTTLTTSDVNAHTMIELGKGLAYLDTYKNKPNVTINNILGPGVTIDVTGDGMTPAGVGGGGLGKITVNTWGAPGMIKTTQGITSFTVKNGDSFASLEVDPNHLGAATVGNVGSISIPTGQWAGTGMEVEGVVAKFLTKGLAQGSTLTAGAFGTVSVKGNYAGTIIAKYDPTVFTKVGTKTTVVATGAIGNVTIVGDLTGSLDADGKLGNVTLSGTARFQGSLHGAAIGNLSAANFIGTGIGTGPRKSITSSGSIGTITTKAGGLTDYLIAAGMPVGQIARDALKTALTAIPASIGAINIKGGGLSSDLSAPAFGAISVTGGNFSGTLTAAAALKSLTVTGGSLTGDIHALGAVGAITVKTGSVSGNLTAASFGAVSITTGNFSGTLTSLTPVATLGNTLALKSLTITNGDLTGDVRVLGAAGAIAVKGTKTGPGGNVTGASLVAHAIASLTVAKNFTASTLLAGADLGADHALGGGDDTFGGGTIGTVLISGNVNGASVIAAGLSSSNAIFKDGDDTVVGGAASVVKSFTIGGTAADDSYFAAGLFKAAPKIAGVSVALPDLRFKIG